MCCQRNLYRIEAVGSNSGQEKILEQIQEILPDRNERLLYLQAGTVGFLQANGDFGDAISNDNIKNCFYCQPMTRKPVCSYYQKKECFLFFNIQQKPIAMNHKQF